MSGNPEKEILYVRVGRETGQAVRLIRVGLSMEGNRVSQAKIIEAAVSMLFREWRARGLTGSLKELVLSQGEITDTAHELDSRVKIP